MANITYGTNIQFGAVDPTVSPTSGQDVMYINNTTGELWYFNTLGNAWECVTCPGTGTVGATNGLTFTTPNVLLGGTLIQHTTVQGASTYDMTWDDIRTYNINTGRSPVASDTSITMGSTSIQGLVMTHTDLAGGQQNSNFSLNHTISNVWDQRNGVTDSASITQYGTSTNDPTVEVSAVNTSTSAKIFTVKKTGYAFSNVPAMSGLTDLLYYDTGTGEISYGPAGTSASVFEYDIAITGGNSGSSLRIVATETGITASFASNVLTLSAPSAGNRILSADWRLVAADVQSSADAGGSSNWVRVVFQGTSGNTGVSDLRIPTVQKSSIPTSGAIALTNAISVDLDNNPAISIVGVGSGTITVRVAGIASGAQGYHLKFTNI